MPTKNLSRIVFTGTVLVGLLWTSLERTAHAQSAKLSKAQSLLTLKSNEIYQADGSEPYRITDPEVLLAMIVCCEASDQKSLELLANLSVAIDSTKKTANRSFGVSLPVYPARDLLARKGSDVSNFLFADLRREKIKCLRRTLRLLAVVEIVGYEAGKAELLKQMDGTRNLAEREVIQSQIEELDSINPQRKAPAPSN